MMHDVPDSGPCWPQWPSGDVQWQRLGRTSHGSPVRLMHASLDCFLAQTAHQRAVVLRHGGKRWAFSCQRRTTLTLI